MSIKAHEQKFLDLTAHEELSSEIISSSQVLPIMHGKNHKQNNHQIQVPNMSNQVKEKQIPKVGT